MALTRVGRLGRRALLGLAPALLGACYTYRPLEAPLPEQRVSVVLTDAGRVESARQIGPETQRIEGSFLGADDTAYMLAVASVKPIGRDWVRWSGEEVSVRRDYVAQLYERRLHKTRTGLLIAGITYAALTAMVRFDILGFGRLDIPIIPGGGDTGDQ